ncbi:unnamed protein product [Acanthocheilonema viteae]|uniref:Uncharacterized protein n=1 Tax=Acanthocheilonema viteae TaxID=6277 RepID=A0A498S340_ACAVI|nr:unnamed protein product [Acanthocheilonema viteae]
MHSIARTARATRTGWKDGPEGDLGVPGNVGVRGFGGPNQKDQRASPGHEECKGEKGEQGATGPPGRGG